ncbi:hypothetical protein SPBR_04269 [Sporothrix brasiliensis 5110]|uniref:DUF7924 domain-containing protein n=1 Tax=Sporothrix brasiliensis 5110 TaxID=1398154 RepID=A0A0C2IW56_9PEZI|nr:uncharacterized protein SPBR_04269 [Sporothrix brasiliensis 5110]KIH93391.1 hypothetical protein SPBR_04269 [Sporothrix brasiliensis 5110]
MPNKTDLVRFARRGGPDLTDVRNCSPPVPAPKITPGSYEPSPFNTTTTTEPKTEKSTPYNRDFNQHLTDHDVHATYDSQKPANWAAIRAALLQRRPSLLSSRFSECAFDTFQESNDRAKNEDAVMVNVMPAILGTGARPGHQTLEYNTLFSNLAPLTDGTIVPPKPDIYYGAHPKELSHPVRDALSDYIIPSTLRDKPLVPNFFTEVKGPNGNIGVGKLQACYDGAVGSRAIHRLQNYGREKPQYDGHAYTFSSIYHGGQLQLYAHHATAPTTQGGRPEYHVSQVKAYAMTSDRETFVQGVTAFRNARDLAQEHRDRFIRDANEAVRQEASQSSRVLVTESHEEGGEREEDNTAEERKNGTTPGGDPFPVLTPPVTSTAGSATKKQTKRRYPGSPSEVSVHRTRAGKRLCRSSI